MNGGFEDGTSGWDAVVAEFYPQSVYFQDSSENIVAEVDGAMGTVSSWAQSFQVPGVHVGVDVDMRILVSDRPLFPDDVGGLLIRIIGPDGGIFL